MTKRPILFSAPMVRALLDGSKTQTRRVLKQATGPSLSVGMNDESLGVAELSWLYGDGPGHDVHEAIRRVPCPHGQPGDRLWVRETFFAFGRWETRFSKKKGRDEWHFVDMTTECGHSHICAADGVYPAPMAEGWNKGGTTPMWWKRPAIFMPRAASRLTLEVAGVRVERLQDISDEDLACEGLQEVIDAGVDHDGTPRDSWRALWTQINGPESWASNPWVWVVEFKVVKP